MSVSKRETPFSSVVSTDHRGSIWQEMPGRDEIAVKPWQQAFVQSLSEGDLPGPAPAAWRGSEECPQQSWEAQVLPAMNIMQEATRSKTKTVLINLRNMIGAFSQMPLPCVKNSS